MPNYDRSTRKPSAKRRLDFGEPQEKEDDNSVVPVVVETNEPAQKKWKSSANEIPSTPERNRNRKRRNSNQGISTYFSPKPASKRAAVVTPEKKEQELKAETETTTPKQKGFVPIYIHKNLNYQRRGQATLNPKRKEVFELIQEHCIIPDDFENNRTYGPLSGTCFEERAIDAYEKGLLKFYKTRVELCTYCAAVGHEQDECPELV